MSEKGTGKQVTKQMRTRCYYTDYVNHAIRFYLTCPEVLSTAGKRKADIENWMAVQAVFYRLPENDKQVLTEIYRLHHRITEAVRMYCDRTGADEQKTWILITKTSAAIARKRGLI